MASINSVGATRFRVSWTIGIAAGFGSWFVFHHRWPAVLLVFIIVGAFTQSVWALTALLRLDGNETRDHANASDVNDTLGDIAAVLVLVGSLGSIGIMLATSSDNHREKTVYAAMSVTAILAAWTLLHTLHMARYARLYYQDPEGGIDFNNGEPPRYSDFAYFSFNLGMTYQVSDTSVSSSALRTAVLKHCMFSYVYGTVIIATTINLVLNLI
ncbi:DUF1345 domain-containing protein [Smaragdicoccus niigatensis]|uniref:DUF1345 domain-containing protein n=1 Tax=Smaragdicoccus niigatensis TaxID=359359 RepID=UPI00037DD575|nr:DUF1345 domain-containing protein [Smaragdicoccus niigatensis]